MTPGSFEDHSSSPSCRGMCAALRDTAESPRVDAVRRALDAVQADALADVVVSS